jgi:hypothetical protein
MNSELFLDVMLSCWVSSSKNYNAFIFRAKQLETKTAWPCRWRHYDRQDLITERHEVIFYRSGIFSFKPLAT